MVPPTAGVVEPLNDNACRLLLGLPSVEHLAVWVAMLGFDFEEPVELHEIIAPCDPEQPHSSTRLTCHEPAQPRTPGATTGTSGASRGRVWRWCCRRRGVWS